MLNATPLLRLYGLHRQRYLTQKDPSQLQEQELLKLVARGAETKFGRDHHFSSIDSVKAYQERVSLRSYEDMWREYWKESFPIISDVSWPGTIPYFAVSSGTTSGTSKYIPCTREMIRANTKAGLDLLLYHLQNRPNSKIFGGKNFLLGGSTELVEKAPGIFSGDLSGIAAKTIAWWARARYFPPQEIALLKDWEEKITKLAPLSFREDIRMISGVPSWLLIFFEEAFRCKGLQGANLHDLYPNLELVVHGGVNFRPYRERFQKLLGPSKAELREVYPASEGFIGIADQGPGEGLRLIVDNGLFFEFVPVEDLGKEAPTRHWMKNVEKEVNYAIVLTSCAGAWSYILGDTVKFIELSPPRILITGRVSYSLSAFGEHLIGEEIERAVSEASSAIGVSVEDFSVGPVYPEREGELGRHLFVVELTESCSREAGIQFADVIDGELRRLNEDYDAHRAEGYGLNPPEVLFAPRGTFMSWMKKRGKLGGQNKVPRVLNDPIQLKELVEWTKSRHQGTMFDTNDNNTST